MKLSKETEEEIRHLYQAYWDAYLSGDFETFASFLDDDIVIYGTAVGEIFSTKEDALAFYTATAEEMTGKAEFRNKEIRIQPVGDTIVIYEQSQLYILIEDTWTYYGNARITGIFEQKSDGWKLVHQHGSFPDSRTEEGQQIASEKIKEENLQLREAVRRRTVELENKTRELEIETSLERVRAVAMGMRKPDDMLQVCRVISAQLQVLSVKDIRNVQTAIIDENGKGTYINYQYFTQYGEGIIEEVVIASHPAVADMIQHMQQSPDAFFSHSFTGEELQQWKKYRRDENQLPDPILENSSAVHFYFYSIGQGGLGLSAYTPLTDDNIAVFHRFRNVFALAYQRFRDIEHAEAQAREAQIELALERLRARTMAMQHSEELSDVVKLLYEEFDKLKISNESTDIEIGLINEETGIATVWAHLYLSDGTISTFSFPFAHFDELNHEFQQWKQTPIDKRNELFITTEFSGDLWDKFVLLANQVPELAEMFRSLTEANITKWVTHNAYFSHGLLTLQGTEAYPPETLDIQKRFAKVFEQTFIRFLDLQKAEANARESKIETALERVRSRTMAMQKSTELKEVIQEVYDQFAHISINIEHTGFILDYKTREDMHIWLADRNEVPSEITIPYFDSPHWNSFVEAKEKGLHFFANLLTFEEKNKFYHDLFALVPGVPEETKEYYYNRPGLAISTVLLDNVGLYIENFSGIPYTDEENATLRRFGKVFQQTYTRFLDLQKAESQTQKVKIEVALERVRARALAMQEPEELVEVAQVMRHEMGLLGVEELETSSIYIHDSGSDIADCWYAITDNRAPGKKLVADHIIMELHKTWVGRQMLNFYNSPEKQISIVMQGTNRIEWINYCSSISNVLGDFYGEVIPDRTYHLYKFSNGAIGAAAEGDISEESWELLRRATSVFSLAYSRFKDLTQTRVDLEKLKTEKQRAEDALEHLKAVQTQLIQSEKMASLGELTAGIAHEIQNPLNFVNNFSEVNTELIDELQHELNSGNTAEAKAISTYIKDNEQKINHHGKRADAIVKGMLQHSRSSSGVKEPTDINALADEYLRLAYHGLRAKDKSFNVTMKTDFDESIGLVNVIPQDIGRVILNLITNAFYVVSEKAKQNPSDYVPTVTITTKRLVPPGGKGGQEIAISVSDNGPGIPASALDKIFQPFFTTKPTGQGTGLGLSLSYDIVKAHGGELKVETKEGMGSVFVIQIPV